MLYSRSITVKTLSSLRFFPVHSTLKLNKLKGNNGGYRYFMKSCTKEKNSQACNCSYPCSRKGVCCDCISYHRAMGQIPACYFPADIESGYDRSISNFISVVQNRGTGYLR
jgi:hypothetical protein